MKMRCETDTSSSGQDAQGPETSASIVHGPDAIGWSLPHLWSADAVTMRWSRCVQHKSKMAFS